MAKLIYSFNTSLDGYIKDAHGDFNWSQPSEEVHRFWNEHERRIGTSLYGRRLYETMVYWEDPPGLEDADDYLREYAEIWQDADKIVYSRTLTEPSTARTRIESSFDPDEVARLKQSADRDLSVGGAELGAQALRAGLVDELNQVISPVIVGGGTHWLPDGLQLDLELEEERRFASGAVHLRYRVLD
jgi:dihydrofolate reductase